MLRDETSKLIYLKWVTYVQYRGKDQRPEAAQWEHVVRMNPWPIRYDVNPCDTETSNVREEEEDLWMSRSLALSWRWGWWWWLLELKLRTDRHQQHYIACLTSMSFKRHNSRFIQIYRSLAPFQDAREHVRSFAGRAVLITSRGRCSHDRRTGLDLAHDSGFRPVLMSSCNLWFPERQIFFLPTLYKIL